MIGLFRKRALQKKLYSAKETYDFKDSKFVECYGYLGFGRYNDHLLQIIGLFCKRALQKKLYSAKEIYDYSNDMCAWQ